MTKRGVRRYVDDLLAGRRPKPFTADDFQAAQVRTAIELQATREGADEPRPEFLESLKQRLAHEMSEEDGGPDAARRSVPPTRRQVVIGTAAAATAAVAAVSVDRLVSGKPRQPGFETVEQGTELVPNDGSWQQVAQSAELPEGAVHAFDLGAVNGFVRRVNGRVEAVSGVCTHQGCRLWLDQAADRLRCPCHVTSFSAAGQVLSHQLPIAPKPLPHFEIRERAGVVEVLAPPTRPA